MPMSSKAFLEATRARQAEEAQAARMARYDAHVKAQRAKKRLRNEMRDALDTHNKTLAGRARKSAARLAANPRTGGAAPRTATELVAKVTAAMEATLRVESAGGKCGALKEGPLDATPLCDVLRGSLQCKDFTMLVTALEELKALDGEFGDVAQARGLTQRIRLLRIKDRFAAPTSGGWEDAS